MEDTEDERIKKMLGKIFSGVGHKMVEGELFQTILGFICILFIGILEMVAKIVGFAIKIMFWIIKKIFYFVDYILARLARYVLAKKTPIENKVMFLTFQGDYTCNPKKIADEIISQELDYQLVWDVKTKIPLSDYPLELDFVKHNTYEFYRELAASKIIIENTNVVERIGVSKKANQYLFQTWHGSLGIKRLDGDVVMGIRWNRIARNCQKKVNYCLTNSSFESEVFETSYWKGVPQLLTGHARNDIFFLEDEKQKEKIKRKVYKALKIKEERKIFLFAPTHRDNIDESYEALEYESIREALKKRFGGEWQIVIRLHNRLKKESSSWLRNLPSYISDATLYEDMQELLLCTEVGVTDYSSWIFDYVLSKKPGFIVELGLKEFEQQRGFYYPIESTPFPIAKDSMELVQKILEFDNEKYQKDIVYFLEERGCMEDGQASKRIVEKIKELMAE